MTLSGIRHAPLVLPVALAALAGSPSPRAGDVAVFHNGFENLDPAIVSEPDAWGHDGVPYRYEVEIHDPGDEDFVFALRTAPDGMTQNSATGLIEWMPAAAGSFDVDFDVFDGKGGSAYQAWTILVSQGLLALPDSYAVAQGEALAISVEQGFLSNDIDPAGASLQAVSILDTVDHGTLASFTGGNFSYEPAAGFTGIDQFRYQVRAGPGTAATATVRIYVIANQAPVAIEDHYATLGGTTLEVPAERGFTANDLDPEGGTITATTVTDGVDHGSLSAFPAGFFSYVPQVDFSGTDSFGYRIVDASGNSAIGTVSIAVAPPGDPVAIDDHYAVLQDTALEVSAPRGFLANDYDPQGGAITATTVIDAVDHGSLSAFPSGDFFYTPDAGFHGSDGFSYGMRDAAFNTAGARVSIRVVENLPPRAHPEIYVTPVDTTLAVATAQGFLLNDLDPEGTAISAVTILDRPQNGSLSAFPSGSFSYTPDAGFTGIDRFTYTVRDGAGQEASSAARIVVILAQ